MSRGDECRAIGPYVLQQTIGAGRNAIVRHAVQDGLEIEFAVKIVGKEEDE
jgi:hypothetical protein